jgi:hypothetical protein
METLKFPDITPPMAPEVQPEDIGMSSQMEDGTVISRARFTRSRLTFYLSWGEKNPMTSDEKSLLMDFYQNQAKGVSEKFEWTCNSKFSPYYDETFIVRFTGDPPRFRMIAPGYWGTSCTLQEA